VNGFGAGVLSGFGTGLALGGVQSLMATSAALAPFATVVAPVATIGLLGYGAYELFIKDDGKAGKQLFGAIVNVASSIGNVLDGSDWTATDQDLATVGGVVGGLASLKTAAAAAGVGSEVAAQGIARLRAPPEVSVTPEILAPEAPISPESAGDASVGAGEAGTRGEVAGAAGGGSSSFFSVQSDAGAARLMSGGAPWPQGVSKSLLGEGFYSWGSRAQAEAYMAHLEARGVSGLRIMEGRIGQSQYQGLRSLDLRGLTDEAVDAWLDTHSLYGDGVPHSFDHIIRGTGNFGPEFYFSKDVFHLFSF
jgi:hypothetical protein